MGCTSFQQARKVYSIAKQMLGEILSGWSYLGCMVGACHIMLAMEFLDSKCMELVEKHLGYKRPIQTANFYTLVETSGSNDRHDKEVSRCLWPHCGDLCA